MMHSQDVTADFIAKAVDPFDERAHVIRCVFVTTGDTLEIVSITSRAGRSSSPADRRNQAINIAGFGVAEIDGLNNRREGQCGKAVVTAPRGDPVAYAHPGFGSDIEHDLGQRGDQAKRGRQRREERGRAPGKFCRSRTRRLAGRLPMLQNAADERAAVYVDTKIGVADQSNFAPIRIAPVRLRAAGI